MLRLVTIDLAVSFEALERYETEMLGLDSEAGERVELRVRHTSAASNDAPAIAAFRRWLTGAGRATAAMLPDYLQ